MNDSFVSARFRLVSLFAAISIVVIHCIATVPSMTRSVRFLVDAFWSDTTVWAVPFFWVASGYWFSQGRYVSGPTSPRRYFELVGHKVKSLGVPYVLFGVLGLVFTTPLVIVNNYLTYRSLLERTILAVGGFWNGVDEAVGLFAWHPFGNGPLWYVRLLFILFLLAPIWRLFLRLPLCIRIVLTVAAFVFPPFLYPGEIAQALGLPSYYYSVGYFVVGLFLGGAKGVVEFIPSRRIVMCVVVVTAMIGTVLSADRVGFIVLPRWCAVMGLRYYPIFPLVSVWWLVGAWQDRLSGLKPYVGYSFWLYLTHYYAAPWFAAASRYLLAGRGGGILCIFSPIVFAVLITVILIFIGRWLQRNAQSFYNFVCGGR